MIYKHPNDWPCHVDTVHDIPDVVLANLRADTPKAKDAELVKQYNQLAHDYGKVKTQPGEPGHWYDCLCAMCR